MDRRDVLVGLATVAAGGTAGCGLLGGSNCGTPSGSVRESFPDSDEYRQRRGPRSLGTRARGVERNLIVEYIGGEDTQYVAVITEFRSGNLASERAEAAASDTGDQPGASAYLVAGEYVYYATGPNESAVTEFMTAFPPLDADCVDGSATFIGQ